MKTETEAPVTTEAQTPEQQQAQANTDLEAGFKQAHGNVTPPAETPAEKKEAPAATTTTETPAETKARLTDEQLQAMYDKIPGLEKMVEQQLHKMSSDLGRKFGDVERKLQDIQKGKPARKFSADGFKRLKEEFPEIADMFVEGLNESLAAEISAAENESQSKTSTPQEPIDINATVEQRVNAAVAEVSAKTEQRLLTVLHPDWQKVVKSPEFAAWMKTLPEADAKKYGESDDAFVAAEAFTAFKAYKPKSQKPRAPNKERLEAAITPDGDGAPPTPTLDDNAQFIAGFNAVRGGA